MTLQELVALVGGFHALPPREKIRLFAWYLHTHKKLETFKNGDVRACFDELHLSDPQVSVYLPNMDKQGDLLKTKGAYRLSGQIRSEYDAAYGLHQSFVQVRKLLSDLPAQVPSLAEQTFLKEALRCYSVEAYRACIVMTWNLSFHHLLNWLLADPVRLATFNAAIGKRNSKKAHLVMRAYDDFEDLKEREVIDICNTAGVITGNLHKILVAKLDIRNMAAHPSSVVITQPQADDVVTSLVHNVVLALT